MCRAWLTGRLAEQTELFKFTPVNYETEDLKEISRYALIKFTACPLII